MPWISLTSDHVKARLAEEELTAIEGAGGGTGDRLAGIIQQVTSLVRAKVAACHKNELGASGTIPEECLYSACTIAKHSLLSSVSSYTGDDGKLRGEEFREANKFLYDVAKCEIGISTEDDTTVSGSDSGSYGGAPIYDF